MLAVESKHRMIDETYSSAEPIEHYLSFCTVCYQGIALQRVTKKNNFHSACTQKHIISENITNYMSISQPQPVMSDLSFEKLFS